MRDPIVKSSMIASVLVCAGLALADVPAAVKPPPAATPDNARPAEGLRQITRRRRPSRPTGGVLERKAAIPTKPIAVINAQKIVDGAVVDDIVMRSRRSTRLPLQVGADKAPAVVELVELDGMPGLMAVYPEAFKAVVNVKALAADGASKEVVTERLRKQIIRAALFVLGSGYSPSLCFAHAVANLQELDNLNPRVLSMETMNHLKAMPKLGIHEVYFYTYRQACREGWAPGPTNDVQKAIWNEYHTLPSEPIKIKPEAKKVAE